MQKFDIAIAIACLLALGTMLAVTISNGSLAVDIGRAEGFYVVPMNDLTAVAYRRPHSPFEAR
jgi:hypothetical protein